MLKRRKHSSFVCGDFNINLLSLDNVLLTVSLIRLWQNVFFPRITLLTRIQNTSHTLIENILSNNIEDGLKSKSGVLINDISDHKIIFTYEEKMSYVEKNAKYINVIEKQDELSLANFVEELTLLDIHSQLDQYQQSNPQHNYETFSKLIKYAKENHLPKRKVEYNRKQHFKSNWIIKSI